MKDSYYEGSLFLDASMDYQEFIEQDNYILGKFGPHKNSKQFYFSLGGDDEIGTML